MSTNALETLRSLIVAKEHRIHQQSRDALNAEKDITATMKEGMEHV